MARVPRKVLIDETQSGVYHCIQRAVRRAFLCGYDSATGNNYDHRKGWIRRRMEQLAGQFGVEVCSYAVMSNHLHVILRNRPDVVKAWSDDEVALRWWNLFPRRRDKDGLASKPEDFELKMLTLDKKKLKEVRERLSSISWFMRALAEPIARRANKEDQCTGRFWEGRFKCQPLLDEAAILACSAYVDLNPVRAGVAKTPESSEFTSAHDRIKALKKQRVGGKLRARQAAERSKRSKERQRREWLCQLSLVGQRVETVSPVSKGARTNTPGQRATNKGFLPVRLKAYLKLLDWTGRQIRDDKRGSIPSHLQPILDRLQINGDVWVETVKEFGRKFRRAAGSPESLSAEAARQDSNWLQGTHAAATVFG